MALTSPGVEVTIIDQSQYLPAAIGSVPLVVIATAQNKADPTGTGVAVGTTAANAGKLYQITSQRDLVTIYGNPFFYTTTNGTPIQGYELNEYGLLAAYSVLGASNRCYVLRADIDLASLVGKTGRPTGAPDNGTWWLDTTNTDWGIYVWNLTTGKFTEAMPIVISDDTQMSNKYPLASLGNIGDYAVYAPNPTQYPGGTSQKQFFYKGSNNAWVTLGGIQWLGDIPTIISSETNPTLIPGTFELTLTNNSSTATITISPGDTIYNVSNSINALQWTYLKAGVVNGKLVIYSKQITGSPEETVDVASSTSGLLEALGIPAGTYYQVSVYYGTSAELPLWGSSQTQPHPTGSVWMKIGAAGGGYNPVIAQYSSTTAKWNSKSATFATSEWAADANLDPTGGKAIPAGTVLAQYDFFGEYGNYGSSPVFVMVRSTTGPTVVSGSVENPEFTNGPYSFAVSVSSPGNLGLSGPYTVTLNDNTYATDFVTAWAAANIPFTTASVGSNGQIVITHTEGGEIVIDDTITTAGPTYGTSSGLCETAGFVPNTTTGVVYGPSAYVTFQPQTVAVTGTGSGAQLQLSLEYGVYNLSTTIVSAGSGYNVGDTIKVLGTNLGGVTPGNDLQVVVTAVNGSNGVTAVTFKTGFGANIPTVQLSNWALMDYVANEGAPVLAPANDTNWFYSVVDEVDILVNANGQWNGYRNVGYDSNGFPSPTTSNTTDPNGPIVSASAPTTQSDGMTPLSYGDLWIDTSDLEMYPLINRWQSVNGVDKWVLIDNADQVTSEGVAFADARWATNGSTNPANDPIPTIKSLLSSDYLDLDAPESSLYPTGMLLFNTRRSGYNVKQFKVNYFNGIDFPDMSLPSQTSAWVSESGLMSNGAPYMGRKAQRNMVVKALRSVVDTNTDIRDEDNFFNLMATPNYPELQPNMVVLNNDRGDTGYILGDTPLGLPDSATAIQAWATNAAGASSTGEDGCVTRDTYLGLFYPSGITSDLSGNLVAVPPSHMMLRTFIRNDSIAYPWLAAAGTRRGIIDNATNIGYLNRTTGEFVTTKTRIGIRDTLYTNFINPLVFFTGNGLLNYGNKTSYNSQSALDRTNVARLIAYVRRQLTLAARPFIFEPNDALTRKQIASVIETLMVDLVAKRGVYDYLVVCDESNNTPARIDRNELWVDVAIEPVKAAEFIYIPVRVLNTGEIKSLG